jgi:glyoxylase-like metal-dependent hydrolase (beta-lactamase superfamily II)
MEVVKRNGAMAEPLLAQFFDAASSTFTHVVACRLTGRAAVIDPVLDFEPRGARTSTECADQVLAFLADHQLSLDWILETHVHADHLSAAQYLKQLRGGRIGIGARISDVQRTFVNLFGLHGRVAADGSQFDRLWRDGDRVTLGSHDIQVLATPGHTCESVTYLIGGHAFVGDTVFRTGSGTARCDFPGGDAGQLYDSICRLYALPANTRLHFCHDYPPAGEEPVESQSVAELRLRNVHLSVDTSREKFVTMRRVRDATLPLPALIIPALQVNIAAGRMPAPEGDGRAYLRMPLNSIA